MKKSLLFCVCVLFISGCQEVWDATAAGRNQQAVRSQRLADEQRVRAEEKFNLLYAEAEKNGDTELCLKILEAYARSFPKSQLQPSSSPQGYDDQHQRWMERQDQMHRQREAEHNASFDRMQRGGLP